MSNGTEAVGDAANKEMENIYVATMLSVFSFFGTFGNLIVLYTYGRRREKATSTIFILALAITDFCTCLVVIPFTIVAETTSYRLEYVIVCKTYHFLITSNVPYSAFIMVGIAFDRYFCICHPFLHAINVRRAKIIVLLLAILAASFGVITAQLYNVYEMTSGNVTESLNSSVSCNSSLDTDNVVTYSENISTSLNDYVVCNNTHTILTPPEYTYTGVCVISTMVFSEEFMSVYQNVYSCFYLFSFVVVVILYMLIYRTIHQRRARKARKSRKNTTLSTSKFDQTVGETQFTVVNGHNGEKEAMVQHGTSSSTQAKLRRQSTAHDRLIAANIKTAAMLFVVTIVFLLAFLPAWLIAHEILPPDIIVFYLYFVYNVANPIIYAFMNPTFREDLMQLVAKMRRQSSFRV